MTKSWFSWRSLRRSHTPARPSPEITSLEIASDETIAAAPLRLLPKKQSLWARFGRKSSPFDLRPGVVESWMKPQPSPMPRPGRHRDDDRGGIGAPPPPIDAISPKDL